MLFNAREFWLYESVRNRPVAHTRGEWAARGSRTLLHRFCDALPEPLLVQLLRHLCHEMIVTPLRVTASGEELPAGSEADASALLGVGGSARVFCVAREGGRAALNASTAPSREDLEYEFDSLRAAAAAGAPVAPVIDDSLVVYSHRETDDYLGGGFVLRDVCERVVPASRARVNVRPAFAALRALHAAGFSHGDAMPQRLPNLVALTRRRRLAPVVRRAPHGTDSRPGSEPTRARSRRRRSASRRAASCRRQSAPHCGTGRTKGPAYDALAAAAWADSEMRSGLQFCDSAP